MIPWNLKFSLVSKLTENIKTKKSVREETGEEFGKYFPTFVMVVRDFFLELKINGKDCTANQYLENSLRLKPGQSADTRKYNAPRECIKEFFTRRKCYVLPKPVDDTEKLRNLESVHEDNLKVEFLQKSDEAVKDILKEANVFKVDADIITASSKTHIVVFHIGLSNKIVCNFTREFLRLYLVSSNFWKSHNLNICIVLILLYKTNKINFTCYLDCQVMVGNKVRPELNIKEMWNKCIAMKSIALSALHHDKYW